MPERNGSKAFGSVYLGEPPRPGRKPRGEGSPIFLSRIGKNTKICIFFQDFSLDFLCANSIVSKESFLFWTHNNGAMGGSGAPCVPIPEEGAP